MRKLIFFLLFVFPFTLTVSSCGQTGPLYLPDKTKPKSDTDGSFLLYK